MRKDFANGIAWGEAKSRLFELVNSELEEPREKYFELLDNPKKVEKLLQMDHLKK